MSNIKIAAILTLAGALAGGAFLVYKGEVELRELLEAVVDGIEELSETE